MDSAELTRLEVTARHRYEWARLVRSALGFTPVLAVVAFAALLGKRPSSALIFGGLMFLTGVLALWHGKTLQRAVLPGVATGLIPLVASLAATMGHGCSSGHCSTLCLPACTAGGVLAGVLVSTILFRRGLGWPAWGAASAVSLLTGAMGCTCVGYSGVLGMGLGFLLGVTPHAVRRIFARAQAPRT